MSLTNTTLSAACTASDVTLKVTSTSSGFPAVGTYASPKQVMQVDAEKMLIEVVPASGTVKVLQRGYDGTAAVAHDILAQVTTSSDVTDFPVNAIGFTTNPSLYQDQVVSIGQDLTFTAAGTAPVAGTSLPLPLKDTTYLITKASACAITIISGTAAQASVQMKFISGVAAAHVITYTAGFYGDTTSSDLATFAAKVGANLGVTIGYTGLLSPTAINNVTIA